jgi:glycopeptide antibiotics resistance protein
MQSLRHFFRRRPDRSSMYWFVGGLVLILLGTLAPFNFTPLAISKKNALKSFFKHPSDWFDFYGNIVLFFPYGLGLGGLLKVRRLPIGTKIGVLVLLSFGLTLTVEMLQLLLPSRSSSAIDIFTNTLGGTLSGLYVLFDWIRYARQVGRKIILSWSKTWVVLGLLLGWLVLMSSVTLKLQSMTDLTDWNPEFRLTIANEATGDMVWDGKVSGLSMIAQALDDGEVRSLLQSAQFPTLPNAQLDYDLTGKPPYADRSRLNASPLLWRPYPPETISPLNISPSVRPMPWFSQDEPARDAINAIRQSHAFTLSTTIATNQLEQSGPDGPVPILTVSWDVYQRNVSLLQSGDRLLANVRTPLTGKNGEHFVLRSAEPLENRSYRVVMTYQEGRLRLYTSGQASSKFTISELILKPEFTFFQFVLPDEGQNMGLSEVNHSKFQSKIYPLVFYAIWSLPLGTLMLRVFTLVLPIAHRSRLTQLWLMLWLMVLASLPTLLLAGLLTTSVSAFSPTKWLICWIFSLVPIIWHFGNFDRLVRGLWKFKSKSKTLKL